MPPLTPVSALEYQNVSQLCERGIGPIAVNRDQYQPNLLLSFNFLYRWVPWRELIWDRT